MRDYKPNPGKPELMDEFYHWLKRNGGTGVFTKTKAGGVQTNSNGDQIEFLGGGRVFIAGGNFAPFMTVTINQFVETGKAKREGNRVTLV